MSYTNPTKNIGYHTRLYADNTKRVVGGSFGGSHDAETVRRLVNAHFAVVVKDSGTAVFIDREGREVTLYITVDASSTAQGQAALRLWHTELEKKQEANRLTRKAQEEEINDLMDSLPHDEIVRRLKGEQE